MNDPEQIKQIFRILGNPNVQLHDRWVSGPCPFAEQYHEGGTDDRPSFGISVGERSNYNCFACGKKGTLSRLPTALFMSTGHLNDELRIFIFRNESLGLSTAIEKTYERRVNEEPPERITEEDYEKKYQVIGWGYRGLTEDFLHHENIRYCEKINRIIIPIRKRGGSIIGLKGRALFDSNLKYLLDTEGGFKDPKVYGTWYGEHWPTNPEGSLIIVEGEIDALLLRQEKPEANIRAAMGVGVTKRQIERLQEMTVEFPKGTILFLDDDKAGRLLTNLLCEKLHNLTKVRKVKDYHGCNDPGEAVVKRVLRDIEASGLIPCQ